MNKGDKDVLPNNFGTKVMRAFQTDTLHNERLIQNSVNTGQCEQVLWGLQKTLYTRVFRENEPHRLPVFPSV